MPTWPWGVLHCQHGQWGLEALIPWWLRAGTCTTSNPEETDKHLWRESTGLFMVCYMFGVFCCYKLLVIQWMMWRILDTFHLRKSLKVRRSVLSSIWIQIRRYCLIQTPDSNSGDIPYDSGPAVFPQVWFSTKTKSSGGRLFFGSMAHLVWSNDLQNEPALWREGLKIQPKHHRSQEL